MDPRVHLLFEFIYINFERKLQTIRQQGNTYLLLPSILGPHFLTPAHG